MMGIVVVVDGRFKPVVFDEADEDTLRALNRLQAWGPSLLLADARCAWTRTCGKSVQKCAINEDEADLTVKALKRLCDGGAVTLEELPCPVKLEQLPAALPATQAPQASLFPVDVAPGVSDALTQVKAGEVGALDDEEDARASGPPPKRLRGEEAISRQSWQGQCVLMSRIVKFVLTSTTQLSKDRKRLKVKYAGEAAPQVVEKLIDTAFRLLDSMTLGAVPIGEEICRHMHRQRQTSPMSWTHCPRIGSLLNKMFNLCGKFSKAGTPTQNGA